MGLFKTFAVLFSITFCLSATTKDLVSDCGCVKNDKNSDSSNSYKFSNCMGGGGANPTFNIFIPNGTYYFRNSIRLKQNVKITGESEIGTGLISTSSAEPLFVRDAPTFLGTNISMSNLTLSDCGGTNKSTALYLEGTDDENGVNYSSFNNLKIIGFNYGIQIIRSWSTTFDNIFFGEQYIGSIKLGRQANNIHISNCVFHGKYDKTEFAIYGDGSSSAIHTLRIDNCNFEHFGNTMNVPGMCLFNLQKCYNYSIQNCHMEGNSSAYFKSYCSYGNIEGNLIQGMAGTNLNIGSFTSPDNYDEPKDFGIITFKDNTIHCANQLGKGLVDLIGGYWKPSLFYVANNSITNTIPAFAKILFFKNNYSQQGPFATCLSNFNSTSENIYEFDWANEHRAISINMLPDKRPVKILGAKLKCIATGNFYEIDAVILTSENGLYLFRVDVKPGDTWFKGDEISLSRCDPKGQFDQYIVNNSNQIFFKNNQGHALKGFTPRVKLELNLSDEGNF